MYSSLFCRLYNDFGWNEYPRVFAEQLLQWLKQRNVAVRSALDLGCGTGVLCEALHGQGIDTLGVDLSREMLDLARQRGPGLRYAVMDFVSEQPGRRFDLATCTGDALNHVAELADVEKVFSHVHDALNPGGHFVFDLLNPSEIAPGEPFEAAYGEQGRVRFMTEATDDGRVTLHIDLFEGGEPRFSEIIREKIHDVDAVCALLRRRGFEVLQCADRLLLDSDNHGTTWFIVARRAGA